MTQPTSVNMAFDTSLVDVNVSFSTTESDSSDFGLANADASTTKMSTLQPAFLSPEPNQENPKAPQAAPASPNSALSPNSAFSPSVASQLPQTLKSVHHIPTVEAYDQWASVYDSDGNMLQSIDDDELSTLFPNFVSQILSTSSSTVNFVDLGCGTGRNTIKLISYPWPKTHHINITALDFSAGMLDVAAKKIDVLPLNDDMKYTSLTTRLEHCDCFPTVSAPSSSPFPSVPGLKPVDAVISTLVLEHIPLSNYFSTLACLLATGGYALITNMHSEMGNISQAGFVNEAGVKVRGESFAHGIEETREEARRAGFEVLEVRERKVERRDLDSGVVGERGGKWVGVKVWFAVLLRKVV